MENFTFLACFCGFKLVCLEPGQTGFLASRLICHENFGFSAKADTSADFHLPFILVIIDSANSRNTPQPLYNTVVGIQENFSVSYPFSVISKVKCIVI